MTAQDKPFPPAGNNEDVKPRGVRAYLRARRAGLDAWRRRWFPPEEQAVKPEIIEYLPDIDEIIAEPLPPRLRITHYLVAGLFCSLLLIGAVAKIDIVVVGSGRLITSQPPMVLQPLDRAIIREIKVKPGDRVRRGQVLVTLDPTFAQADVGQYGQQNRALLAEIERLDAELAGKPYLPRNAADPEQALQLSLYTQRQSQLAARIGGLEQEASRVTASLQTAESNREALVPRLALANEVEHMRESLYKGEIGSKLHYLGAQDTRMQMKADLENTINRMAELRHELAAKQAERETFVNDWRRQILEQLIKARQDAARVGESLAKAVRINDLIQVVAPEDGVVLDIAKRSVGSVVREAEPILTLIPAGGTLEADVEIASADVGYLKPGDSVRVKVDAFPYQRHGFLEGTLRDVGQDSFSQRDDTSLGSSASPIRAGASAFHRGHVELTKIDLERMPEGAAVIPGMTVSAEIKVGSRSILSFFLWPILRGMGESLREP